MKNIYLDNKRYHTLNHFYQNKFGCKVCKISLNAGLSCPNIDGTLGYGGCIYCSKSGSGEYGGDVNDDLVTQFNKVKSVIDKKWKNAKYIPYFQAHTNTYASVDVLREMYESVLCLDNVVGLSIATRCDAISDEVFDYLCDLNKRTFLTIELGLQTIHENTSKLINRCHTLECFENMVKRLKKHKIHTVVHIINGLPYETKEMMLETVKYLDKLKVDGIKIHMLNIVRGTKLAKMYEEEKFSLLTKDEYVDITCDQIELLSPNVVIHRASSDPKKEDLIEPTWLVKKFGVLNDIDKELRRRNTYQGFRKSILNKQRQILEINLKNNDIVVDATVGNGNDTLFLANLVKDGYVYGFDIQKIAISNTKKLLDDNNVTNYTLINKSHEFIFQELSNLKSKVTAVVYNLGYLPKGDKSIVTKEETTIKSIKEAFKLLNNKGFILVVVYPHLEGKKEAQAIKKLKFKDMEINEYHNDDNVEAPYLIEIKKNSKQKDA